MQGPQFHLRDIAQAQGEAEEGDTDNTGGGCGRDKQGEAFLAGFGVLCWLQQCPVGFAVEQRLGHKQLAAGARWPQTMILRGGLVGSANDPPHLHLEVQLVLTFLEIGRCKL